MDLRRDLLDAALTPCEVPSRQVRLSIGLAGGLLIVWRTWDDSSLGEPGRRWAAVATVVVALIVAELTPAAQRMLPTPGVLPLVPLGSAVAVYACVPEVNNQMPTVFAVILVGLGIEVLSRQRLPLHAHLVAQLLVLWSGMYGATGRQSALVGAIFSMWPVVLVGLVVAAFPQVLTAWWVRRWTIAALGGVAAIAVARTGALASTIGPALASVAVFAGASLGIAIRLAMAVREPTRTDR